MKIILLDNRYFDEKHVKSFSKMILKSEYIMVLCEFPRTDYSMIKIIDTEKWGE